MRYGTFYNGDHLQTGGLTAPSARIAQKSMGDNVREI